MTDDLVKRLRKRKLRVMSDAYEAIYEACDRIEQLEALLKRLDDCFQRSAPLFGAQWCRSVHISDALIEDARAALAGEKKDD
jgi:hypothetical protein